MTRVIDTSIPSLSSAGNAHVYDQYNGPRPRVPLTSQEQFPSTQHPATVPEQQGRGVQGVHASNQPIVASNPSPGSVINQSVGQYRGEVHHVGPPVQAQHQHHLPGALPVRQLPPCAGVNNPVLVHQYTNHCGPVSAAQPKLHLGGYGQHSQ